MLPPQPPHGYIVNTNRTEHRKFEAEERMLKENCVFVTGGEKDFQPIRQITAGDAVFLYANKVGVISFGIAVGQPWLEHFMDLHALFLSCGFPVPRLSDQDHVLLRPVNPAITHGEMEELFGKKLAMNQAVKTLEPPEPPARNCASQELSGKTWCGDRKD